MPYVDLNTIHNPATGTVAPATWGDQVRDNLEFLIDPPTCSVYASVAQSVTSGSFFSLTADSELFDNDALHSTVTNTSRITIQTAGRYLFIANLQFEASTATRVISAFFYNGTTRYERDVTPPVGGATDDRKTVVLTKAMAVGTYMEVQANQNSGSNKNVTLNEFAALFITR